MNKKGFVEVQFNWIFILIIGSIILLFFSVVIMKQKSVSEVSTSSLILRNLEGILSGAEVSLGTVNSVSIPKTKIEFECNRYRVGKVSKEFEVMSIFTPSIIESNKLITWTVDWSLPYRVTNLLYLTSPRVRYIFVGENGCIASDTCFAKKVFNSTPDEVRKELIESVDVSGIRDKGDDQVRIILFDSSNFINTNDLIPPHLGSMNKGTLTALNVDGDEDKGTLEFFDVHFEDGEFINKETSYYIREPALLGAIFADDIDIYNCVMEDAFKKLNIVSQIYEKKTQNIAAYYSSQSDTTCAASHDDALAIIQDIITKSQVFTEANINDIDSYAIGLENKNKDAQLYSCALIY